ncbi:MAG TPA: SDR family oxidoreductase [Polyangiales bacterium]|nr:SDR family oxidoreductase [Polyangiales bacterium]
MQEPSITLVTGANGNLGRAVVQHLESSGLRVARVESGKLFIDAAALAEIDLGDPTSVRRAFGALVETGVSLAAIVHTVGVFRSGHSLPETPDADFVELFQTNVMTTVHVIQAALPLMLRAQRGRIAVVASLDALAGRARVAAYGASKAAQLRVIESAAQELRGSGITINAVLPSTMDTPQNRAALPDADPRQWVSPSEVASTLAFLVSDAASRIHGQAIRVER